MTISSTTRRAGPFAGNGVATTFPFTFKVFAKTDLTVLTAGADGSASAVLTLDSDYSVALNANQDANPGGTVAYPIAGSPMTSANVLAIVGGLLNTQPTDITNGGGFYPNVIEDMGDRSTIQIQQLAEAQSRALVFSPTDDLSSSATVMPSLSARANMAFGFDGNGDPTVFAPGALSVVPDTNVITPDLTLSALLLGGLNRVVDSIASLRALKRGVYTRAFVTGYYTAGDGGGGAYHLDPTDTASADNGGTVIVATDNGRWKLQVFNHTVPAEAFGAKGVGTANDDSGAFQAAATWLSSVGGGTLTYSGKHYLASSINLPRNVSLIGPEGFSNPGNPSFSGRTGAFAALQAAPKLILATSATINALGTQVLRGCLITRAGLALDGTDLAASYAGTAVAATNTDGVLLDGCTILGFTQAFIGNGSAAILCNLCYVDCTNGFLLEQGFDVCRCLNCHCYNFLQANVEANLALTQRNGYAYRFTGTPGGGVAGPSCVGCFAYGYRYGFHSDAAGSDTFVDCWADGPTDSTGAPLWADSIGFNFTSIEDANAEFQVGTCRASAQAIGAYVGSGMYGVSTVDGIISWNCMVGVKVASPGVVICNSAIRSYFTAGIQFADAASANGCSITETRFYGRQSGAAMDIDCGGGEPIMRNVGYIGDKLGVFNIVPFSLTWISGNELPIPTERDTVLLNSVGNIGNLKPVYDGRQITLAFAVATTTPYTGPNGNTSFYDANPGGNFRTKGAFLATAGSVIRFRYDATAAVWREMYRTVA